MKPNSCTREPEVVAALLHGTLTDGLKTHASACEVCSEVVQVAGGLLHEVVPASMELRPPDASVIWRRAQSAAREKAIAKATQPIRLARIGTVVAAAIALPWLVVSLPNSPLWIADFTRRFMIVDSSFSGTATGTILLGAIGSLFLISLSSWYMLREE